MCLQVLGGKCKEYFDLSSNLGGEVAHHVSLLILEYISSHLFEKYPGHGSEGSN